MYRRILSWWVCRLVQSGNWRERRKVSNLQYKVTVLCKDVTMNDMEKQRLIDVANTVRRHAYVPYSNYRVGAAVQTKSGRVFTGVNVENASYPETMCAERVAIFKAVSEGEKDFEA